MCLMSLSASHISASLVSASLHLCISASLHLCISASLQHNTKDRTKDKQGKKDRGKGGKGGKADEDTPLPEGQGAKAEERKHSFHIVVVDRAPVGEDGITTSGDLDQVRRRE